MMPELLLGLGPEGWQGIKRESARDFELNQRVNLLSWSASVACDTPG
jgi:hypothetical protein